MKTILFSILALGTIPVIVAIVLAVALIALIAFCAQQKKVISRQQDEIDAMTYRLEECSGLLENFYGEDSELPQEKEEERYFEPYQPPKPVPQEVPAKEAAQVNEEYISGILGLCSDYISKVDSQRKELGRLVQEKNWKEVEKLLSSPLSDNDLKDFFKTFDGAFLSVYPDFVSQFNSLLREDERIEPKGKGRLSTQQRIFALVRLGMTDSGKIADFLHCSVQTVYNNRQMIRRKAISKDNFDEQVLSLGKA